VTFELWCPKSAACGPVMMVTVGIEGIPAFNSLSPTLAQTADHRGSAAQEHLWSAVVRDLAIVLQAARRARNPSRRWT
jgi:hypothetical protein